MSLFIFISLSILMIILSFSCFILWKIDKVSIKKDVDSQLAGLTADGLNTFSKRTISIIFQLIVYMIILLWVISIYLGTGIDWFQWMAFILGTIVVTMVTFLALRLAPHFVPKMSQLAHGFLEDSLRVIYDLSYGIGFLMVTGTLIGLLLGFHFFGAESIIGYGLGVLLIAFFLRVGGGVFHCSAKIARSCIARTESKMPHDRRNPSVFLDMMGSYIGDMVGYAVDMMSSFMVTFIAIILSLKVFLPDVILNSNIRQVLLEIPLYLLVISILVSCLTYLFGRVRLKYKSSNVLLESIYLSLFLNLVFVGVLFYKIDLSHLIINGHSFMAFSAYFMGVLGSVLIGFLTDYYTSPQSKTTCDAISQSDLGMASPLLHAFSGGLQSNAGFILILMMISLPAYFFAGVYGVALASMGILSVMVVTITTRVFASFSTNLYQITQLSPCSTVVEKNIRKMRRLGGTTSAVGNGFSAATSVIATASLLLAVALQPAFSESRFVLDQTILLGIGMGAITACLFSGALMRGIVNAIACIREEVLRQFKDIPYLLEDKAQPDVIKASDLHTIYALRVLTVPGLIFLIPSLLIGPLLGFKVMIGYLLGIFFVSIVQGYSWCNFGDSISNAVRHISDGFYGGQEGKPYHHSTIAENYATVFSDVLGPNYNILIKSSSVVTILVSIFWFI